SDVYSSDLLRIGEQPHLEGDLHVADHRPAGEGDLPTIRGGGLEHGLDAVDVGGEARHHHELPCVRDEPLERGPDLRLGPADPGGGGVGGVHQQQVDALVAEPRHLGQIGRLLVGGQLIELDVTGHHHRLTTGLDDHAQALGDRVVDVEVADLELARGADGRLVDLPEDRLD